VQEVVRACNELGIRVLTFYAFSTQNWDRPGDEVEAIMGLLEHYMTSEAEELDRNGIRVRAIGRVDDLQPDLRRRLESLIQRTEHNDEMWLTFALPYSGRGEIVDAVRRIAREVEAGRMDPDAIDEKCIHDHLYSPDLPEPDLLIRTGEEHRISNFLLWQLAYTELYFTDRLWPDFTKRDLVEALVAYQARERRFGRTAAQVRGAR
jgi:undecaprenyl diphosphate synthase